MREHRPTTELIVFWVLASIALALFAPAWLTGIAAGFAGTLLGRRLSVRRAAP